MRTGRRRCRRFASGISPVSAISSVNRGISRENSRENGKLPGWAGSWNGYFGKAIVEARPSLDLLAGGHRLAAVKQVIAEADMRQEETLAAALAPHVGDYDYVILDT